MLGVLLGTHLSVGLNSMIFLSLQSSELFIKSKFFSDFGKNLCLGINI